MAPGPSNKEIAVEYFSIVSSSPTFLRQRGAAAQRWDSPSFLQFVSA